MTKIFRSESFIQANCIAWFRNEYERHGKGVIIPVPNELAAKRKDVIIRVGCSDLIIALKGKVIFVEMKTAYNGQSDAQLEFQQSVEALGFEYKIIRTLEAFKELVYENL